MTPIEARELRKWLEGHDAVLNAQVREGAFVVLIQSRTKPVTGVGHSPDDFEGAIRAAQHFYDLGLLQMARITTGPVGRA